MRHLFRKMEEMALAILSVLLQRNPDLKLSPADIAFLRPPGAPPLATARMLLGLIPRPAYANLGSPKTWLTRPIRMAEGLEVNQRYALEWMDPRATTRPLRLGGR